MSSFNFDFLLLKVSIKADTHVLQRPGGVDERLDLALAPEREHALDGAAHVVSAPVLEQKVPQIQPREALVLVKQLDRGHFVHLPPLGDKRVYF